MIKQMKKMFSSMLAVTMIMSGFYFEPFISVHAANVDETNAGSQSASDESTLKQLGFELPEEVSTNDLIEGKHVINSMSEIVAERFGSSPKISVFDYDAAEDTNRDSLHIYDPKVDYNSTSNNMLSYETTDITSNYALANSISFDMDGDGKKESVARLHLNSVMGDSMVMGMPTFKGFEILLSVSSFQKDENGNTTYVEQFVNQPTGGFFKYSGTVFIPDAYLSGGNQAVEGFLSITAGDFDGDGTEELAIYLPNNEQESTTGTNTLKIGIFDLDASMTALPAPTMEIDVNEGENGVHYTGMNTTHTAETSTYKFQCFPFMALTADDANGDGIDDLLTCTNFTVPLHGYVPNDKNNNNKWSTVLDPNSRFTSLFDFYEGKKETGLKHTIYKRPLIGKVDDNCAYVLRNARAIVANVSAANSGEIVFAGNMTKIDYTSKTTENSVVITTTDLEVVDNAPRIMIGYTTHSKLVSDKRKASTLDYTWIASDGEATAEYYGFDSVIYEPVELVAFAPYGSAFEDTLFVDGQCFSTDGGGVLNFVFSHKNTFSPKSDVLRYVSSAVAGNVINSPIGAETLYYIGRYKGEDTAIRTYVVSIRGKQTQDGKTYADRRLENLATDSNWCDFYMVDIDDDSPFIEYTGETEIYYSDVEAISVLQAAPVWGEFDESYLSDAETSFTKMKGSGFEENIYASVSAGVVFGLEEKTSFLGLFTVAGVDYEVAICGNVGYDYTKSKTTEFSTSYATSGDNDTVVITTIPYVSYKCKTYIPTYNLPTKEEYEAKKEFAEELEANLYRYLDEKVGINTGKYNSPYINEYIGKDTTNVTKSIYDSQVALYQNYIEWLEMTEGSMSEFDAGGTHEWGQEMPGGWVNQDFNIPKTPIVTTISVETYDEIARNTKGLTPIYGNVFSEKYRAGDPSTYPRSEAELNATGDVLSGQTGADKDKDGFITCTNISSSAASVTQSISVTEEVGEAVTYGASIDTSTKFYATAAKVGFALSIESGGSSCWINTAGLEYSGTVPNFSEEVGSQYSYSWKLVSYMADLNGKKVPVVGYLTKVPNTPPPSVTDDLAITALTDQSVSLGWSEGEREASYYQVYRVTSTGGTDDYRKIGTVTADENGKYTFTDNSGLRAEKTYNYAVKAFSKDGVESVYSDVIVAKTMPSNLQVGVSATGLNEPCIAGVDAKLKANLELGTETKCYDTEYQWQVDDGSGYENIPGATQDTYVLRTSTLKNGNKYRCVIKTQVGEYAESYYTFYSNALVQNARRAATKVKLSPEASHGLVNAATKFVANIEPEAQMATQVSGEVVYSVKYMPFTTFALRAAPQEDENVKTYTASVEDGKAIVEIPFEQVGQYEVSAAYSGNETCDAAQTEQAVIYYVHEENEEFAFADAEIILEKEAYEYTGEQICPEVIVSWNGITLVPDVDYLVRYGENIETGSVEVVPIGDFAGQGSINKTFEIVKAEPELKIPEKVRNLAASDDAYNKVALTWTASEGATEYDVYQKAHDSEKFEFVATVTEAKYTATVKMTGKENKFYVVAKNEAGASDASKVVAKATTLHGSVKLNMKKVSTAKFELSWNKIAGATRYIIYSKRGGDGWKKVLTLGKDKLSYVTAELPNGEYSYIIRAARYDSSDRIMTAKSNAKTGTVEAIAPTVSVKVSGTKATLTWNKLEGVTYYQVFRKTSKEGKYTTIKTTSAQKYTTNVSKTKTYYFKVRGYKAYKSGANSKYNVYTPYSAVKTVKAK